MTTPPSWDHQAFREYVIARAKGLGIAESTADLSRASSIGRSMLSKWFNGSERPSPRSLERLAGALHAPIDDLMQLAGWSKARDELPTPPPLDEREPDLAELERMLSDTSRLTADDKAAVRAQVHLVVLMAREKLRNGGRRTA